MNQSRQLRALFGIYDLPEPATLKDTIDKRYGDLLYVYLADKIRVNPDRISRRTRWGAVPDIALVRDMEIVRVDILGKDGDAFSLDVIAATAIEIAEMRRPGPGSDRVTQWFRIRCTLTLASGEQAFAAHSVAVYRARAAAETAGMSQYLIPYIGINDLDAVAENFLARYFPTALEAPCPVSAREVADRMGLNVKYARLTEDMSIYGQVFFADSVIQVCDDFTGPGREMHVAAGTILIDWDAYCFLRPASVNSTILHECVHWDKDRSFFILQKQFYEEMSAYACWAPTALSRTDKRTQVDRIEWQTRNLTPRIQLPVMQTRRKTEEIMAKYKIEAKPGQMVHAISEVAEFYGVTWQVAKQRLTELGFRGAREALQLGTRKANYLPWTLPRADAEKTHGISTQAAFREYLANPAFRDVIDTGHFQYVEGHFCIGHERYICPNGSGGIQLTEYARNHLSECCLPFTAPSWAKHDLNALKRDTLYRSAGRGSEYEENSGMSVVQTAQELGTRADEIVRIMKTLPAGFGESLDVHMKRLVLTGEQLADRMLVSPKMIQRMLKDDGYLSRLKTVVALCIALRLAPALSFDLIRKAGFSFKNTEEHMLLHLLITSCYDSTVYECNEILQKNGYKALTNEE